MKQQDQEVRPPVQVIENCPEELAHLDESKPVTMGQLLEKYVENANTYYECREAALQNYKPQTEK